MTVKELKKMLEGKDDDKNIVFISGSGVEWTFNTNVLENPKKTKTNDGKSEQVVIFIT